MALDLRQTFRPIYDKTIEPYPEFKFWFEFGIHGDGTVDIFDGGNYIIISIEKRKANDIIAARNRFLYEVLSILNAE